MNRKGNLNLRERIDIEKKYTYGETITDIAKFLKRNKSVVSREIDGKSRKVEELTMLIELIKNI